MDVHTLKKRELELPVANVDPKGRYALSINFDRMFDFRPGYGYAGRVDKYIDDNHPANDGIFLIDLQTGKSKLIISLEQLWELTKHYLAEDKKVLVNHITFNTDGSRFVFLLRYFPEKGKMWETSIITANTDGSDIYCLSRYFFASHYHWKSPNELLIYAYGEEGNQLYELKDKSNHAKVVDVSFFLRDGHCSYSPDRSKILYDSYPDEQGYRNLYIYDVMKKKGITLASYFAYPDIETDIRCDLHPRWNPSGTEITFDSVHEGQRGIYHIKLNHINL